MLLLVSLTLKTNVERGGDIFVWQAHFYSVVYNTMAVIQLKIRMIIVAEHFIKHSWHCQCSYPSLYLNIE